MADSQTKDEQVVQDAVIAQGDSVVGATVFSENVEKEAETPEWLAEASVQASQQANDKIASSSDNIPNLRTDKPSDLELGLDPSSIIEVDDNLEVVVKADAMAAVKMMEAGYDPKTGKQFTQEKAEDLGLVEKKTVGQLENTSVSEVNVAPELKEVVLPADPVLADSVSENTVKADLKPQLTVEQSQKVEKEIIQAKEKRNVFEKVKGAFNNLTKKNKEIVDKIKDKDSKKSNDKVSKEEKKAYVAAEKLYWEGLASVKDLIAPSSMEIKYDSLRMDGMYAKSFYAFAYPRYFNANWLSPVINFDISMDISQFIYPIDSSTIMKTLKKKVAQMQSSLRINAEKGKVRDPALETALEDAEVLRTQIQRGQEKFFQFALYFTLYSESEKKLEKISKQLESLLAGKMVVTKRTQLQAEHGLNSTLPMALDELYVIRNMNTSPLSTTFPFTSSDLTSDRGILYGLNRHNDSLIIFDRFALENANSVVFAKSGAGKSYAVKLEILRLMMMGTDVIVIDPENEYESLATTVGGTYLKLSLNSDRRINPFDLPKPLAGDDVQAGDLLRSNIITLHGLLKVMLGGVSPSEEGVLDKALIDTYGLKGITMELVDPSIYEPPTMGDLQEILNSMDGAKTLVQKLSKFTTGSYSGIFNKPTNVDMSSGLMIFSIRDLEDELRPTAMYIVLNYIWNRVRSELKKRVLVVDEAWSLMQHEDSAKFLFGLVKRARKYYLGVSTITQDVEDFVKSDFGKPIITNSSMQVLLKQAPSAVNVLADIFNLTEGEKYVLLNSGVGQGLFFAGLKHVAIQVIASYTEDKIVTSDPQEILKAQKGLSLEEEEVDEIHEDVGVKRDDA